jgi:hypothetical protein
MPRRHSELPVWQDRLGISCLVPHDRALVGRSHVAHNVNLKMP